MRSNLRLVLMVGVVAGMAGACSPVIAPAGLTLSSAPVAGRQISQCSMFGAGSPEAARMGIRSPLIQLRSIQSLINQIQARASLGYSATSRSEGWKSIASGEC